MNISGVSGAVKDKASASVMRSSTIVFSSDMTMCVEFERTKNGETAQ